MSAFVLHAIGYCVVALLVALAAIHLYWAVGGRRMRSAAIPEMGSRPLFKPSPLATAGVAVALLASAVLIAIRLDAVASPLPQSVTIVGCWALAAVFLLRAIGEFRFVGLFKRVRGSRFARLDTAVYTPLCVALGLAIAMINMRID